PTKTLTPRGALTLTNNRVGDYVLGEPSLCGRQFSLGTANRERSRARLVRLQECARGGGTVWRGTLTGRARRALARPSAPRSRRSQRARICRLLEPLWRLAPRSGRCSERRIAPGR